jgi:hypothetical protein
MDYRYVEIEPEDHGTIIPTACPRSPGSSPSTPNADAEGAYPEGRISIRPGSESRELVPQV